MRVGRSRVQALLVFAALFPLLGGCSGSSDGASRTTRPVEGESVTAPPSPSASPSAPSTVGSSSVTEPVRLGSFAKLVPLPRSVEPRAALFTLVPETVVVVRSEARQDAADAVDLLRSRIGAASGLALPVRDEAGTAPAISFTAGPERWAPEHYTISVTQAGVDVVAADHDGFVWAVQTLVQALPPEALSSTRQPGTFALPAVVIDDAPRYRWRAAMLDLARHFFGPDDVKAFVDEVKSGVFPAPEHGFE